jgi:RNA polymerase sigma-70 factor, ECF subfamily
MDVRDAERDFTGIEPAVADSVESLASVCRDFPGLRALIARRVGDPELAADIMQDAAVTTLEKLRDGKIAQPSGVGGYLYRVALNHLRNHRRKDRTAVSSSADLELLVDERSSHVSDIDRAQWARVTRMILDEMPTARDREVLVRFYLDDESREDICAALALSDEHFNRVIFRARNRFRALLERRGYEKRDIFTLTTFAFLVGIVYSIHSVGGLGIL